MRQPVKALWVNELLHGGHQQTRHVLHNLNGQKCANGVLCELAYEAGVVGRTPGALTYAYGTSTTYVPDVVLEWAGLDSYQANKVTMLNDAYGHTFEQIADHISREL